MSDLASGRPNRSLVRRLVNRFTLILAVLLVGVTGTADLGWWQSPGSAEAQTQGPLGWTLGESWIVAVTAPAISIMEPSDQVPEVTHQYRYTVIGVPSGPERDFVIEVTHADPQQQPERARGPLFEVRYRPHGVGLALAGVRAKGKGRLLQPDQEETVIGELFPTLAVPERPFTEGAAVTRPHQARGGQNVAAKRHRVKDATEDWAPGDPWRVAFDKPGKRVRAELVKTSRQSNEP